MLRKSFQFVSLALTTLAAALAPAVVATSAHAQSFADGFEDGKPSTYWQVTEAVPALSIGEANGRLEFTATADPAQSSKKFAGYLSQNWHMRTSANIFARVTVHDEVAGVSTASGSMQSLAFGFFKVGDTPDANGFPGTSKFMEVGARRVTPSGSSTSSVYRWIDFMKYTSSGESEIAVSRYAFPDDPTVFYSSSSGLYAFNFPYTQQVYMRYTTGDDTLAISLFSYNGPYIVQIGNFTNGQRYPVGIALGGYTKLQSDLVSGKAWYDNLYVDSATIDAAAPNFAASDGTYGDKVVLTWTAAPGASGYKVFRTPKSGGDTVELATGLSATALSYEDTTADRLVEYTYALQTLTAPSGDTEYQAIDTGWRNIDVPTGVVASDSTYSDKIRVTWNSVTDALGYGVYRAVGTATPALVGQTDSGVTQFDDTTAAIGTTYLYTVQAISALGPTGSSNSDSGTRAPYPPLNVAASDGSFTTKNRVSWSTVAGASGYRIYRRTEAGTAAAIATANGASTAFYDDTTAATLTTYYYSVSTMVGSSESARSDEDTGWRNVAPPTLTAGAGTSTEAVNLSWTAVAGATGYTVRRAVGSGTPVEIANGVSGTTYSDTGVDPLVLYTYTVFAELTLGDTAPSIGVNGWMNVPPPTSVSATDGEFSNRVVVSWSAVSGATGYSVWRKVATATTAATQIATVTGGAVTYNDNSAATGTNYLYSVKAIHALGTTAISATDSGWRSTAAPTTTAATDGTYPDKVRVTWSSVSGATGYKVFRATGGGDAAIVATLTGAGTVAFDDTTATAVTSYSYFVRSTSAAGDSSSGPTDSGWRNLPTPTGVAASDGTFDDRVRITWNETDGALGYKVFRKLGSAAAVEIGSTSGASSNDFDDTTAEVAKSYAYSVKAVSALGDSLMSATDAGIRAPAAPLNVSATDGTLTTGVRVSWSLSTGATGYKIYRRTEGGVATYLKSAAASATSYEDKTAVALTTYIYSVVATATGVTSAASDEDSGWRNIGAPTTSATLGTSSASVNVSWTVVSGATGYRVQRAVSGGSFDTLGDLGTVTTYADTTADPLVVYQYRVLTLHTQGASNPSNAPTGWRNIDGPSPITATDGEFSTKVTVAWPAISGATGYTVWRKTTTSTAAATQIANINDPAQLSYDDTTAAIGTGYTYSVRSKHALGQSLSGTTDAGWRNTPAPTAVAATDGSYTDKIRVTWGAATAATGFRVYRRQGSDTPVQIGSTASAGARTFDDTTANPAQNYDYFISAVLALGESAQSAPNSGWRAVAAPTLVAASDGTFTDRVRVTWQAVTGASGYKVYRKVGAGATVEIANLADPAASSFDDQTVGPVTLGTYSVIAQSALGPSATSLTNTGWCNLNAPTGVAATDGAFTTKVVVSWQAVTGATGYRVYRSVNGAAATQIGTTNATTFLFNDTTVTAGTVATYTVAGSVSLGLTAQSASDTGFRALAFAGGGADGGGSGGEIARNPGEEAIGGGGAGAGAGESSDESDAGSSTDEGGHDGGGDGGGSGISDEPSCDEAVMRIAAQVAALEAEGSERALALADRLAALIEPSDGAPARACAILAGDIDGDGAITGADLVAFLTACAADDMVLADINRDGAIDLADLAIVERRIAESVDS